MKKILASLLASAFLMTGLAMATASAKAGDPHETATKTVHAKKTPKPNAFDSYMGKHHKTITRKTDKKKPKVKPKPKATHTP